MYYGDHYQPSISILFNIPTYIWQMTWHIWHMTGVLKRALPDMIITLWTKKTSPLFFWRIGNSTSIRTFVHPQLGVGPGFDYQGSVTFFHNFHNFSNVYWIHCSICNQVKWFGQYSIIHVTYFCTVGHMESSQGQSATWCISFRVNQLQGSKRFCNLKLLKTTVGTYYGIYNIGFTGLKVPKTF